MQLIQANPACARIRDEHEQRLPLHIAAKWGATQDVVLTIMTHHPEGVYIRDAAGKTPMDYAKDLPAHRKLEVVKALKQGPLLSAVSKAAMQRAAMTDSMRDPKQESPRSIPAGTVPVSTLEARIKQEKANAEKAYASIIGKMETRHKREVELAKAEAEAEQKKKEAELLAQIEEAQVVAASERKARAALELMYEAEVVTAKEEAQKHKEELTISNRTIDELKHSETLAAVSTLPLRQKIKAIRADLEQEWEKNRTLTEENEVLKDSKQKVDAELSDQTKALETIKADLLETSEKLVSHEDLITKLRESISSKETHVEQLVATIAGLETELDDQEKVIDAFTDKLRVANEEIETNKATIAELKEEISKKDAHAQGLDKTIICLKSDIEDLVKVNDALTTKADGAAHVIECNEATIGELKGVIADKDNDAEEHVATIERLENALAYQEKEIKDANDKLCAANDEISSKEVAIGMIEDDIANKEALIENLTTTVAGLEAALVEQEKESNALNDTLRAAEEEIESKESAIAELKKEISNEVRHAQGLAETIAGLESDLESQKKENEALVTKVDGATHVIESNEIAIADLKNEISEKETQIDDFLSTVGNLGIELNDQKKVTESVTTKLHVATQEIESKNDAIADLKYDVSEKEARIIELKQELADALKEIESKNSEIKEKELSIVDVVEENKQLGEVKSRLHVATEEILLKASMISMMEAQHSEKESKCDELSRELEDLIPKFESETERSATLAQQVSDLTLTKTSLELELKEAIVDLELTKEKVDNAMTDIERKNTKINELDGVILVQRKALEDMTTQLDALRLEHTNEQQRAAALEENIQSLEAEKAQLQTEVAHKTEEVDKAKSKMFDLVEDVEMKSSKINGLEVLLANEESRCEELTTELEETKTELESAETQVTSLKENVSTLEAAKESLEASLNEKTVALKDTETTLDSTAEEREAKIAENLMLEGLLSDKYAEIEELGEQLKIKQAEADRAIVLEKQVDKTTNDLTMANARSDELQMEIAHLNNMMTAAQVEIKKYKMRARTVEKWVSSFALSIQGWRLEADQQEDLLITETATDLVSEIDDS